MRVLVVPDKFKGTLSAEAAARAIAAGWRRTRPQDAVDLLPMSDGGDGFGPVIGGLLRARARSLPTSNAAGRPHRARWWWAPDRQTAIIEAAQSNGLALLPPGHFHPFDLDTFGVGRLIHAARRAGAKSCLIGIGGSATNDGGFGLARALGWRFLDQRGRGLLEWTQLDRLAEVVSPEPPPPPCEYVVATDVSNPLLGPRGASRIYGPQKGLTPRDLPRAEKCLAQLARVVHKRLGFDSRSPGSGAAGGLGFGLQAFLGATRRLGFDLFSELADLDRRVARADLVITGEGSIDASTRMGKGVGQLLARCAQLGRPIILLGGRIQLRGPLPPGVRAAHSLMEFVGEQQAMTETARSLRRLAATAARNSRVGAGSE